MGNMFEALVAWMGGMTQYPVVDHQWKPQPYTEPPAPGAPQPKWPKQVYYFPIEDIDKTLLKRVIVHPKGSHALTPWYTSGDDPEFFGLLWCHPAHRLPKPPAGIEPMYQCGEKIKHCEAMLLFDDPKTDHMITRVEPLSMHPSLVCPNCQQHGYIHNDEWSTATFEKQPLPPRQDNLPWKRGDWGATPGVMGPSPGVTKKVVDGVTIYLYDGEEYC